MRIRGSRRLAVGGAAALLVLVGTAAPAVADTDDSDTTATTAASSGGGVWISSSGGSGLPLHRIGIRTGTGGVRLRLYEADFPGPPEPVGCFPDHQTVVELSTRHVATQVVALTSGGPPATPVGDVVGIGEGTPIGIVVARVPVGTREVAMHFTDKTVDRMKPMSGGWVVLAAPLDDVPEGVDRPVPLLTDTGVELGDLVVTDRDGETERLAVTAGGSSFAPAAECFEEASGSSVPLVAVPPTLPAVDGPTPEDADAARAEIERAYRRVFQAKASTRADPTTLEGAPLLSDAELRRLNEGYGDIQGKIRVRINDLRFVSPTEALVHFDLLLAGEPTTAATIGRAVFQDGHWKVARDTFCDMMARATVTCTEK